MPCNKHLKNFFCIVVIIFFCCQALNLIQTGLIWTTGEAPGGIPGTPDMPLSCAQILSELNPVCVKEAYPKWVWIFFKHIPRHDKLDVGGGGIVIYLFILQMWALQTVKKRCIKYQFLHSSSSAVDKPACLLGPVELVIGVRKGRVITVFGASVP